VGMVVSKVESKVIDSSTTLQMEHLNIHLQT
jgi:hypothetical protein